MYLVGFLADLTLKVSSSAVFYNPLKIWISGPRSNLKCDIQCLKKQKAHADFLTYVLVCTAQTTKSMKTNNIPLKTPIKLQQEMKKKIELTKICQIFRAFFEKAVFLENGRGRH